MPYGECDEKENAVVCQVEKEGMNVSGNVWVCSFFFSNMFEARRHENSMQTMGVQQVVVNTE